MPLAKRVDELEENLEVFIRNIFRKARHPFLSNIKILAE
jgi:hypothetical protein